MERNDGLTHTYEKSAINKYCDAVRQVTLLHRKWGGGMRKCSGNRKHTMSTKKEKNKQHLNLSPLCRSEYIFNVFTPTFEIFTLIQRPSFLYQWRGKRGDMLWFTVYKTEVSGLLFWDPFQKLGLVNTLSVLTLKWGKIVVVHFRLNSTQTQDRWLTPACFRESGNFNWVSYCCSFCVPNHGCKGLQ